MKRSRSRSRGKRRMARKMPFRRRRVMRKRTSTHKVHRFVRYSSAITINTPVGVNYSAGSLTFTLDKVINYSEFTQLFDRYKITGVQCKFKLVTNPDSVYLPNSASANSSNLFPQIWLARDYDDATIPNSRDELRERAAPMRVLRPNSEVNFFIKPAILGQTYRTALTTGYTPMWNKWVDCGAADVPHYALKYCIDFQNYSMQSGYTVQLDCKYYIACKDVR